MATVISKAEADARPNEVFDRAWSGEEIVIEQVGGSRLRVIPTEAAPSHRRTFGMLKGKISLPLGAALEPLDEDELRFWEGG